MSTSSKEKDAKNLMFAAYFLIFARMKNLIAELSWRGLVQDIMPGTDEQLQKELTSGYVGFDPTADSLHMGTRLPI